MCQSFVKTDHNFTDHLPNTAACCIGKIWDKVSGLLDRLLRTQLIRYFLQVRLERGEVLSKKITVYLINYDP